MLVMADIAEEIKVSAHINVAATGHVKESKVHGAAAAVAGVLGDEAEFKELVFGDARIEDLLHALVFKVFGPSDEVVNSHLGSVGVIDL